MPSKDQTIFKSANATRIASTTLKTFQSEMISGCGEKRNGIFIPSISDFMILIS
jgi:hypothetical protein